MKLKAAFLKLILLIIMSATFPGLRAQPSTADPDYACINSMEDYWVTNTPGSTYNWVLSGGGTITQGQGSNAIRINWTTTGTFSLTVTETLSSTSNCTGAPVSLNIIVNPLPVPTATANSPFTGGDLNLIGGPDGMASYAWTGPNGFTSTEQNPIITGVTAAAAGTYTLTVTNAGGGTASTTVDVVINPLPSPVITGPNPVCQSIDGSTEIYSTPAHAGSTYNWTIVGGTLSGQGTSQITVLWTTPGIGSVSVTETVTNTGCTATATIEINVQPAPVTSRIYHN